MGSEHIFVNDLTLLAILNTFLLRTVIEELPASTWDLIVTKSRLLATGEWRL
jgi:hypothetical protein